MRRSIVLSALTTTCLALGAGAAAGTLDPLSADPAMQGAVLAAPAVYRVEARYEVQAVRVGDRRISLPPAGRVVTEVGTAFAVSGDGHLVSMAHVAAPDRMALARAVGPLALAQRGQTNVTSEYVRDWVELNRVEAVGVRRISLTVAAAMPDPASPRVEYRATLVPGGRSADDDLVVLKIAATGIPALRLDDSMTAGTPVATIGFGSQMPSTTLNQPPIPAVRVGELGRTGTVAAEPGSRYTVVTAQVETGDSGAPAVDSRGRVHGVVRWLSRDDGGYLVQSRRVGALLRQVLSRDPDPADASQDRFAQGMRYTWDGDLVAAAEALDAAERRNPRHALAGPVRETVTRMQAAGLTARSPGWRRGMWWTVSALSALAAVWCAWRLAALRRGSTPDTAHTLDP